MNKRYFQVDTSVAHLYKITNKKTDEYYVGKHCGWDQRKTGGSLYWGSGERIRNAIKKHGKEYFTYEILAFGSVDYIIELEAKYVTKELIEEDSLCMNLVTGGECRKEYSEETRRKISLKITGRKLSEEHRKKISVQKKGTKYALGYKHTEEAKEKIREIRAKQVFSEESKEKAKKTMSTLLWMNDGIRSYRVRPENIQESESKGLVYGRLVAKYINENYKEKIRMKVQQHWKKFKETNPIGILKKV